MLQFLDPYCLTKSIVPFYPQAQLYTIYEDDHIMFVYVSKLDGEHPNVKGHFYIGHRVYSTDTITFFESVWILKTPVRIERRHNPAYAVIEDPPGTPIDRKPPVDGLYYDQVVGLGLGNSYNSTLDPPRLVFVEEMESDQSTLRFYHCIDTPAQSPITKITLISSPTNGITRFTGSRQAVDFTLDDIQKLKVIKASNNMYVRGFSRAELVVMAVGCGCGDITGNERSLATSILERLNVETPPPVVSYHKYILR